MAADEMLQLRINIMELVPQLADQIDEVLIQFAGDVFVRAMVKN